MPAQKLDNQLFVKREDLTRLGCGGVATNRETQLALLREAVEGAERIRKRIGGNIDVIKLLDEDRESHP